MTDSGGFQVFSMGFQRQTRVGKIEKPGAEDRRAGRNLVRITEDGVYFQEGGEEIYLDAELSMRIQEQLGADIVFAFDECTSPRHDYEYNKKALGRTHAWAKRSLEAKESRQITYGIVQGGPFEDLRRESARFVGSLPFDGFGIGGAFGSSYGSEKSLTFDELRWTIPFLPEGKPRHLLGIGRVEDIFEAVALGIDTFDCVIPTREARHGSLWTPAGRFNARSGRHENDPAPIQAGCGCAACADGLTRSELHMLFKARDARAGRLATIHNIYFFNDMMEKVREAVCAGSLREVRREYLRGAV